MPDIKIPDSCDECIAIEICGIDFEVEITDKACCAFHKALTEKYQERPAITKKCDIYIAKGSGDGKARIK